MTTLRSTPRKPLSVSESRQSPMPHFPYTGDSYTPRKSRRRFRAHLRRVLRAIRHRPRPFCGSAPSLSPLRPSAAGSGIELDLGHYLTASNRIQPAPNLRQAA